MKPYEHAKLSVKIFNAGVPEDYLPIHDFLDSSKAHFPDMRHRAILHSSFGIFIAEQVFGTNIRVVNHSKDPNDSSYYKLVSVRDIAEKHVLQDMGTIPTVQDYLQHLPMLDWLGGKKRDKIRIQLSEKTHFVD